MHMKKKSLVAPFRLLYRMYNVPFEGIENNVGKIQKKFENSLFPIGTGIQDYVVNKTRPVASGCIPPPAPCLWNFTI